MKTSRRQFLASAGNARLAQPRFLKQVQEAVANGREVERLLVEAGKKYIGFLRTQE